MAIRKTIMDQLADNKKKNKGGFFEGLKNFIISPGGIFTVVVAIGIILYVNHKTKEA